MPMGLKVKLHATSTHADQGKAYLKPSQIQAKPSCNPRIVQVKLHATSADVDQDKAYLKPSQVQSNPSCKPRIVKVKLHATSADVDQDKADTKRKQRSFIKAAPIPQEKRATEIEAIHKELVTDLRMAPEVASKVLEAARRSTGSTGSVLSLENCIGWITTLRQLGLDEKGVIQGLKGSPIILANSAAGREEDQVELLRVLEQAGLQSEQVNVLG
eukprot:gene18340-24805_t